MQADNEDFNGIENEGDFEIEQEKLKISFEILVELDTVVEVTKNRSTTWEKNQIAFFKSPGRSNALNIPSSIVGAYYFAKKILNHFEPKGRVEYETYTELLAVCNNWKGFESIDGFEWDHKSEDLNNLEELIAKYIKDNRLSIPRGTVDIWCNSFCDAYKKVISVTTKYFDNKKVSGDSEHLHYRLGNAALILELLYKKCFIQNEKNLKKDEKSLAENISFIELQNMFINEYVLPATDGKGIGFMTEWRYTIAEIIEFNRSELVAWFITNEMHKVSPIQYAGSENDKDKKELFRQLTIQCAEYLKNTNGKSINDTVIYYVESLEKEKFKRNFTEAHMFVWLRQAQHILRMYDCIKGKVIEDTSAAEEQCRGMFLSDSVGVGYGLAEEQNPDRQCYVRSIPRLLKKLQMDTVDIANCSVIGYETSHGRAIIKRELKAIKPHFVIVSLGGNDAYQEISIDTIRGNLEAIVEECIQTTKVIVALGVPETFSANEKYRKELAAILPFLKQKYTIETIWLPEEWLKKENIQEDGLHLKPNIQLPLAQLAVESIVPVLGKIKSEAQHYQEMIPKLCFSTVLQKLEADMYQIREYETVVLSDKMNLGKSRSCTQIILSYLNCAIKIENPRTKVPTITQSTIASGTDVKNNGNTIVSRFTEESDMPTEGDYKL